MSRDDTLANLKSKFGDGFSTTAFRDNLRVIVAPEKVYDLLKCLKVECGLDMLADLSAVDYLHYPNAKDRYGIIYCLTNIATGERLIVKTFVNDPEPTVQSCFSLWKGADWMEREVYDMYGIIFDGHPDLRRILMPEEFSDFPLRKDYPLRGRAERHNFPAISRAES